MSQLDKILEFVFIPGKKLYMILIFLKLKLCKINYLQYRRNDESSIKIVKYKEPQDLGGYDSLWYEFNSTFPVKLFHVTVYECNQHLAWSVKIFIYIVNCSFYNYAPVIMTLMHSISTPNKDHAGKIISHLRYMAQYKKTSAWRAKSRKSAAPVSWCPIECHINWCQHVIVLGNSKLSI